jgi:hypothetical chaperone protein
MREIATGVLHNKYPDIINFNVTKHIYGIDFGTTNSVLAVLDIHEKKIVKVFKESSLLYFNSSKIFFTGEEAINQYLSNNMQGRLLKSVKTLLPQSSFTYTYIYGKKYTPEDLVCLILKELKTQADHFTGENVTEVVLGRPVVFSEDPAKDQLAEKRLLNAAKNAGFTEIWFQYEPIAAGFLHEQSLKKPEKVLIGDFGGGTSDFTLMQLGNVKNGFYNRKADILKTGGVHIGGDDFDAEIMWNKLVSTFGYGLTYESFGKMLEIPVHIFRTLCQWEQMAFLKEGSLRKRLDTYYIYTNKHPAVKRLMNLIDQNLGFSLFQSIERSKIALSGKEFSQILFDTPDVVIDQRLELDEFNMYIQKEVAIVKGFLDDFIRDSPVDIDAIDHIFLTGGSSLLGSIFTIFKDKFSADKIQRGDNFNSVAQGLAWSYFNLK